MVLYMQSFFLPISALFCVDGSLYQFILLYHYRLAYKNGMIPLMKELK